MSRFAIRTAVAISTLMLSVGLYAAHRSGSGPDALIEKGLTELGSGGQGRDAPPSRALLDSALERLDARLARYPDDFEATLLKSLILFKTGHRDAALGEVEQLTRRAPKFHLAHLVRGDLLLTQTRVVADFGRNPVLSGLAASGAPDLASLREEAEARLSAYLDAIPQGRIPAPLLRLADSAETAIVVDKQAHRLYVYRRGADGVPQLVQDFYVSTGKADGNKRVRGDLRTPEGVYFVTRHIPDQRLPDKYGVGAYPINYPNDLDRRLGKTGDGIWLHGTEKAFYSRPPLDSEGCVVLPNVDLHAAAQYLEPGNTPVVIADRVRWLDETEWYARLREVETAVERWRADWERLDTEAYLSHYSRDFWSGRYNLARWAEHKRQVAAGKRYQSVALSDLSLFAYPRDAAQGREMVVAEFRQDYRSNNFSSEMDKRLYLVREEGEWKVLYEGRRD